LKEKDDEKKFSSSSNSFLPTRHFMPFKPPRKLQLSAQFPPKPLFWSFTLSYVVFKWVSLWWKPNKIDKALPCLLTHSGWTWMVSGEAIHNLNTLILLITLLPQIFHNFNLVPKPSSVDMIVDKIRHLAHFQDAINKTTIHICWRKNRYICFLIIVIPYKWLIIKVFDTDGSKRTKNTENIWKTTT